MKSLRIFLADDHNVVRAGLKALINAQPDLEVVGEASDGVELLTLVNHVVPDIVVMDLSMPRLNGVETTQQLLGRMPMMRILILSVHEDATYLRRAIEAGATGYVLKRAAAESLIGAIRVVGSGNLYLDPALGVKLARNVMSGKNSVGTAAAVLSDREEAVLRLVALGYSNKEIAGQLTLSVKTVETYKARAMEKLSLYSRVAIVRYAVEHGWLGEG